MRKSIISLTVLALSMGLFACEKETPCNHPDLVNSREAARKCGLGDINACQEYLESFNSRHVTQENLRRCGFIVPFEGALTSPE
ncbi:hypothetical protein [Mongoliitalea daihaiensis]|uniref:hypothetical protein n=1 Tax=Mongoliitalea daihaiensis TaxID=2782006 RepID=UPI001F42F3F6|nr:hypothetical protein [Mongoliitalea daihaiensis]UJP64025.1 hypothetical protein IPZ59_14520 [Mongoliitalea daihaiensis]